MPNLTDINPLCLDTPKHNLLETLAQDQRRTINRQDIENWSRIQTLTDWKDYCQPRIEALRQSLGHFPTPPKQIATEIDHTIKGNGYTIENIVFESRKNIFVSANRYTPSPSKNQMPGIILVHSHHNPKVQGELQDMGILWARSGCVVLVIDQFGYGDRRDHAFAPRQDYWFRHITSQQLHTLGDSLMGWMVWDIHRCVDLLLADKRIAPNKIIAMGSVAGGGDPCAVAAALDERISCAVPFNFGGPQPETPYPLPKDAAYTFNYLGNGSWESTRNLRLSGQQGFLPWLIVGSMAPRKLIYAHEFVWDKEQDPVWARLQKIYDWHHASDNLDHTQGFGLLKERPPQASHCNNIGVPHRQRIYQALQRWYGIVPPAEEVQERHPDQDLQSLTPTYRQKRNIPAIHITLKNLAQQRVLSASKKAPDLQKAWEKILGNIAPESATHHTIETATINEYSFSRHMLITTSNIPIPFLFLGPKDAKHLVIAIAQSGKQALLQYRTDAYGALLQENIAICLPDLRGTGETAPQGSRPFRSLATSVSADALMFGQTSLGNRLKDLRTLITHLHNTYGAKLSLWGDSLAPTNPTAFENPLLNTEPSPHTSEPGGGLLTLFASLFEPHIFATAIHGMIASYQCLFNNTYCYIPHDAILPGACTAGDLNDITTQLAPRPLMLTHLVDGQNCPVSQSTVQNIYQPTIQAYQNHAQNLSLHTSQDVSQWLIQHLR